MSNGRYPETRLRRIRATDWSRRLHGENTLGVNDLIWPIFLTEGEGVSTPVASMPGVERHSVDRAVYKAAEAAELGIPAVALFPETAGDDKDEKGKEALNPKNLVNRALTAIRAAVPNLGLIADVALDPYTSHGHDGLLKDGRILNDATVAVLAKQAVVQADTGADIVAPSDMMDGRVAAIRDALDTAGHRGVQIMSYAAKYASAFYGPFRDAVGSGGVLEGDKKTYQMNPANTDEALREVALDLAEGADSVIIKPGIAYIDIVRRVADEFRVPVFAYQVSGEYAMIEAAAANGWLDRDVVMMESLMAFKRAGASGIITYFAADAARLIEGRE